MRLARLVKAGPPRMAERARVVLACADSAAGNSGVTAELGLAADTVRKWRTRFADADLKGLADNARPGRPKAGPLGVPVVPAEKATDIADLR